MVGYIDFGAVKQAVSIEEAAQKLDLKLTKAGSQWRGPCPACRAGGERALVLTPSKNLFCCFGSGEAKGGDQIALVAHVNECSTREAAEFLAGTVTSSTSNKELVSKNRAETVPPEQKAGLNPLDYLEHDHPAVQAVGFEPDVAQALGLGYAPKGILRGTVAIPLRTPEGVLVGYAGITEAKLPKEFHFPDQKVVRFPKTA